MRREDTPSFLAHFLNVRAAPLVDSFRDWTRIHDTYRQRTYYYSPQADHISYKCREFREYRELLSRFEEHRDDWKASRFIHQSVISGRQVAVIGLVDPISTPFGDLRVLELSEPKPMSPDPGGFDHIEVNPGPGIAAQLPESWNGCGGALGHFVMKERPHHTTWDARIPDVTGGRPDGFILRITSEPLVVKIGQEML